MTYGHSPTESVVAMLQDTPRDTGLSMDALEEVAGYFRGVRKKYAAFEGSLRGIDSRILVAQVPGGMLTNMESQLREQGAEDKFDQVLEEIPRVREDLGFIPLVTPTSQIVGTQAVLNVLTGERYKSIAKETAGVLKGLYGAAPAPVNEALQAKVLKGEKAVTCRPADLLEPEIDKLSVELDALAREKGIKLAESKIDDVLTYALFPQVGLKFLTNRGNPDAFEPAPGVPVKTDVSASATKSNAPADGPETYTVKVNGQSYVVEVEEGAVQGVSSGPAPVIVQNIQAAAPATSGGEPLAAPLAGNIFKVNVTAGQSVEQDEVLIILEAMKMETEIRAPRSGVIGQVAIKEGDSVSVGDILLTL